MLSFLGNFYKHLVIFFWSHCLPTMHIRGIWNFVFTSNPWQGNKTFSNHSKSKKAILQNVTKPETKTFCSSVFVLFYKVNLSKFWFLSWPASGVGVVVVAVSLQLFLLSPATATTSFLSTYLLNTLVQKEGGEQCDQIVQFIGLLATF